MKQSIVSLFLFLIFGSIFSQVSNEVVPKSTAPSNVKEIIVILKHILTLDTRIELMMLSNFTGQT